MDKEEIKDWLKKEIVTGNEEVESKREYIKVIKDGYSRSVRYAGNDDYENIGIFYLQDLRKLRKSQPISNRFTKDVVLNYLTEKGISFKLVGGAVIDVYEGKEPKDYDFTKLDVNSDMKFIDTSRTADTYILNIDNKDYTIQVLKTNVDNFDFTISTCCAENHSVNLRYHRHSTGERFNLVRTNLLENETYKTKILVPCSYKSKDALNSLLRIPHWREKGYKITDNTYRSLLFAAAGVDKEMSGKYNKNS